VVLKDVDVKVVVEVTREVVVQWLTSHPPASLEMLPSKKPIMPAETTERNRRIATARPRRIWDPIFGAL
jgi:hypothetical protein